MKTEYKKATAIGRAGGTVIQTASCPINWIFTGQDFYKTGYEKSACKGVWWRLDRAKGSGKPYPSPVYDDWRTNGRSVCRCGDTLTNLTTPGVIEQVPPSRHSPTSHEYGVFSRHSTVSSPGAAGVERLSEKQVSFYTAVSVFPPWSAEQHLTGVSHGYYHNGDRAVVRRDWGYDGGVAIRGALGGSWAVRGPVFRQPLNKYQIAGGTVRHDRSLAAVQKTTCLPEKEPRAVARRSHGNSGFKSGNTSWSSQLIARALLRMPVTNLFAIIIRLSVVQSVSSLLFDNKSWEFCGLGRQSETGTAREKVTERDCPSPSSPVRAPVVSLPCSILKEPGEFHLGYITILPLGAGFRNG
ncbi:hypothetical protein Bbelb_195000 [Branchiostoma belcheri]|nr:hypothetical protein Bbelb_195000 [Branchiostoma belcheri]